MYGAFWEINDTKLHLRLPMSERHTKLLFTREAVELNQGLPCKVPADGWSGTLIRNQGISPCCALFVLYRFLFSFIYRQGDRFDVYILLIGAVNMELYLSYSYGSEGKPPLTRQIIVLCAAVSSVLRNSSLPAFDADKKSVEKLNIVLCFCLLVCLFFFALLHLFLLLRLLFACFFGNS